MDTQISVWSSDSSAPILVLRDYFTEPVLDIAWDTEGTGFIATAHDGNAVFVKFGEEDIGVPISEGEMEAHLQQAYKELWSSAGDIPQNAIVSSLGKIKKRIAADVEEPEKAEDEEEEVVHVLQVRSKTKSRMNGSHSSNSSSRMVQQKPRVTPTASSSSPSMSGASRMSALSSRMGGGSSESGFGSSGRSGFGSQSNNSSLSSKRKNPPTTITPLSPPKSVSVDVDAPLRSSVRTPGLTPKTTVVPAPTPSSSVSHSEPNDSMNQQQQSIPVGAGSGVFQAALQVAPVRKQFNVTIRVPQRNLVRLLRANKLSTSPSPSSASSSSYSSSSSSSLSSLIPITLTAENMDQRGRDKLSFVYEGTSLWSARIPSPITAMSGGEYFIACACLDGSLYLFSLSGRRLLPCVALPYSPVLVRVQGVHLIVVTGDAQVLLWRINAQNDGDVEQLLSVSACPILFSLSRAQVETKSGSVVPVASLVYRTAPQIENAFIRDDGSPVLVLTNLNLYSYHPGLKMWCRVSGDQFSGSPYESLLPIQQASSSSLDAPPFRSLTSSSSNVSQSAVSGVSRSQQAVATASHLENKMGSALVYGSATDYRHWLLQYVKQLIKFIPQYHFAESRLLDLCDGFLGPLSSISSTPSSSLKHKGVWSPTVLGMDKRTILKDLLVLMASNGSLQRYVSEAHEHLKVVEATNDSGFAVPLTPAQARSVQRVRDAAGSI